MGIASTSGIALNDGALSLIFQPIMAAIRSGITVGLSLLVGLLIRIPMFGRWWNHSWKPAFLLAFGCLVLLVLGSSFGLAFAAMHPETRNEIVMLHPSAALIGYSGLVFAIANWPLDVRHSWRSAGDS